MIVSDSAIVSGFILLEKHTLPQCAITYDAVFSSIPCQRPILFDLRAVSRRLPFSSLEGLSRPICAASRATNKKGGQAVPGREASWTLILSSDELTNRRRPRFRPVKPAIESFGPCGFSLRAAQLTLNSPASRHPSTPLPDEWTPCRFLAW